MALKNAKRGETPVKTCVNYEQKRNASCKTQEKQLSFIQPKAHQQ